MKVIGAYKIKRVVANTSKLASNFRFLPRLTLTIDHYFFVLNFLKLEDRGSGEDV